MWFVFYLINTLLIPGHKICFWAIYHWAFYHFMESNHFNSFWSIENGEINDFVNLASCCACVCEWMAFIWLDLLSLKCSYICLYVLSRARMCYRESWSFFFCHDKKKFLWYWCWPSFLICCYYFVIFDYICLRNQLCTQLSVYLLVTKNIWFYNNYF